MKWFWQRLNEGSTWAGIAVVAATVGEHVATGGGLVPALVSAGLAIILKDKGAK